MHLVLNKIILSEEFNFKSSNLDIIKDGLNAITVKILVSFDFLITAPKNG